MEQINSINGIPLHYVRLINHPYGTRGKQCNFSDHSATSQWLITFQDIITEVLNTNP